MQDDERLGNEGQQKYDTFFFHEKLGPEPTYISVESRGREYIPNPRQIFDGSMKYGMSLKNYLPIFWAKYPAKYTLEDKIGGSYFDIEEKIFCPIGYQAEDVNIIARIVPNQRFFPMGGYNNSKDALVAGEKDCIAVSSFTRSNEHMICKDAEKLDMRILYRKKAVRPGDAVRVGLIYGYGSSKAEVLETMRKVKEIGYDNIVEESREYWRSLTEVKTGIEKYDNLYLTACNGIRAAVSRTGKMNAGIWQYNQE
ncbi:hypothetical protein J7M02_05040 [Candidatus Aerophobetes bacterium]|nr:hypothetical protein [Candidatus Aerophobetes bacterium]